MTYLNILVNANQNIMRNILEYRQMRVDWLKNYGKINEYCEKNHYAPGK